MTTEGIFLKKKITLLEVKLLIADNDYESVIGHNSTAQIMSELLEIEVPVNRIKYEQTCDDIAIVFQLRKRPPEGKILSRQEIEKCGYDFFIVRKYDEIHAGAEFTIPFNEMPLFPQGVIGKKNKNLLTIY
jgi:hypothetical protein